MMAMPIRFICVKMSTLIFLFLASLLKAQIWEQLPDFPGDARDDAISFRMGQYAFVGTARDASFWIQKRLLQIPHCK